MPTCSAWQCSTGSDRRRHCRMKKPRFGGAFFVVPLGPPVLAASYSPSVSNDALPPAAVVLTVSVFSVAKRGR